MKMPIVSANLGCWDIVRAACLALQDRTREGFCSALLCANRNYKAIYPTDSGIGAFFIILEALKRISDKDEVALPAYTAGSLVVAVKKAGLRPVLYDIGFEDFSFDIGSLTGAISPRTLAVVCVHMFGIPVRGIENLKNILRPDIFLIEDCAQAMGSKVKDRPVGIFGDASFFSFGRGKNMSLYNGGCVYVNNEGVGNAIEKIIFPLLNKDSFLDELKAFFKETAFYLATRPLFFGAGYSFLSRFKDNSLPHDFKVSRITAFQSALGLIKIARAERDFHLRYKNGIFLNYFLKNIADIHLPKIDDGIQPAFCRFPVIFKNIKRLELAKRMLWDVGFESSSMYGRPLHAMFNLGYHSQDFPNANYFAEHLLTVPVYPQLGEKNLLKIAEVIRLS